MSKRVKKDPRFGHSKRIDTEAKRDELMKWIGEELDKILGDVATDFIQQMTTMSNSQIKEYLSDILGDVWVC